MATAKGSGVHCQESHATSNNDRSNLITHAESANPLAAKRCSDIIDFNQSAASMRIKPEFIDKNRGMNECDSLNERGVRTSSPGKPETDELERGVKITRAEMGANNMPTDICSLVTSTGVVEPTACISNNGTRQPPSCELDARSGCNKAGNNVISCKKDDELRSTDCVRSISYQIFPRSSTASGAHIQRTDQTVYCAEPESRSPHATLKTDSNYADPDFIRKHARREIRELSEKEALGDSVVTGNNVGYLFEATDIAARPGNDEQNIIIDSGVNRAAASGMGCGLSRDYKVLNESSDYYSFIHNGATRSKLQQCQHPVGDQQLATSQSSRGMKDEKLMISSKRFANVSDNEKPAVLQSTRDARRCGDSDCEGKIISEGEDSTQLSCLAKKDDNYSANIGSDLSADANVYVKRPPSGGDLFTRIASKYPDQNEENNECLLEEGIGEWDNSKFEEGYIADEINVGNSDSYLNRNYPNQCGNVHSGSSFMNESSSGIHDGNHVIERQRCGTLSAVCTDSSVMNERLADRNTSCNSDELLNGCKAENERTGECSGSIQQQADQLTTSTSPLLGVRINSNNTNDSICSREQDGRTGSIIDIDRVVGCAHKKVVRSSDCVHSQTERLPSSLVVIDKSDSSSATAKMKNRPEFSSLQSQSDNARLIGVIESRCNKYHRDFDDNLASDNNNSFNRQIRAPSTTGIKTEQTKQSLTSEETTDPNSDVNKRLSVAVCEDISAASRLKISSIEDGTTGCGNETICDSELDLNNETERDICEKLQVCQICGQNSGSSNLLIGDTSLDKLCTHSTEKPMAKMNSVSNFHHKDKNAEFNAADEPIHVNIQQLLNIELQHFTDSVSSSETVKLENFDKSRSGSGMPKQKTKTKNVKTRSLSPMNNTNSCSRSTEDTPPPIPERTYLLSPERVTDNDMWDIGSSSDDSDESTDGPLVFENLNHIRKSKANEYIESDCIKEFSNKCVKMTIPPFPDDSGQSSVSPSEGSPASVDVDSSHLCSMFNSLAMSNPCYCDNLDLVVEAERAMQISPNKFVDNMSDYSSDSDSDGSFVVPAVMPRPPKYYENKTYISGKVGGMAHGGAHLNELPEHPPLYQEINREKQRRKPRPKTAISKEELENKDRPCTCHLYNGNIAEFKHCLRHPYLEVAPPPIPKRNYNLKQDGHQSRSSGVHLAVAKMRPRRDIIRQERIKVKSLPPIPSEIHQNSANSHLKLLTPLLPLDLSPAKNNLEFGRAICDSTSDEVTHLSLEELVGGEPVIPVRLMRASSHSTAVHHGSPPPVSLHLPNSRHSFVTPPRKPDKMCKVAADKKSPNNSKIAQKVVRSISLENPHSLQSGDLSPEKALNATSSVKEKKKNPLSALFKSKESFGKLFTKKLGTKCDKNSDQRRLPPVPAPGCITDDLSPPRPFQATDLNDQERNTQNFIDSLLKLREVGWYWGPLSLEDAEAKLHNKKDGSFLVRDSSHDSYILSLSFRSQGKTHHTRIEHCQGTFAFWSQPVSHGRMSIIEFIDKAMEHSRNGKFLYFLRPHAPGLPPSSVALLYPISRFELMQSLQHRCRFIILKHLRYDHINQLPLPQALKQYLREKQYFAEAFQMSDPETLSGASDSD
ncbi:uncharacterized protein LOC141903882 [Tubulanus polymorphus]|uniref:uncharacterized protein LOC141903882 n=1 Tax=Tubulanus polymorphus TaxID=672921 RepID=UPI003DA50DF2